MTNVTLILAGLLFVAFSTAAHAFTEKELWGKDHAASLIIPEENPPSLLRVGGPDRYGYYFIDSQDPARNAPRYRWIDISSIGVEIPMSEDDQNAGPFPIGFPFNFYGEEFATYRVCTNGWISFTSGSAEYLNQDMPGPEEPNNLLAVFWDDLTPGPGHVFRYSNSRDTCIAAWLNYRHYPNAGSYTFEIILTGDGRITYQYLFVSGVLNSHAIGIENSDGSIGLQYLNNTYRDETRTAISFSLSPPSYADHDVLPAVFVSPGQRGVIEDPIRPQVRFVNSGGFTESFTARVTIDHNGMVYNQAAMVPSLPPSNSIEVTFPAFTLTEDGLYRILALSQLLGDQVPRNDTLRMTYTAYANMYSTDFESNDGSFVGEHDWQWGIPVRVPTPHSGARLWGTVLDGDYSVGPLLSSLVSDDMILGPQASLSFWHWYDTEALFDGGNVKISTDEGSTWSILTSEGGYDGILSDAFGNPLGGQPAFYGVSNSWMLETFDLSAYADSVVLVKFDFGSDNTATSTGWYLDDLTILGGGIMIPGWIAGLVTDQATSNPVDSAIVHAGRRYDTTGTDGYYSLSLPPGLHSITASASYHNPVTISGVMVSPGDTMTLNFVLPAPAIQVDTQPIDTSLSGGQFAAFTRHMLNSGTGPLDFNVLVDYGSGPLIETGEPSIALDLGDEVFVFDLDSSTGDGYCLGVEFDGTYFWVTGRHSVDNVHRLYKLDRNGNLLETYDQHTLSTWGWRDLAWDGVYLYASDEFQLAVIDPSSGEPAGTLPMPTAIPAPIRGLAYDPHTDHFWGANFTSNIIEFDRNGQTLASYPNDRVVTGLAWDYASPNGPWLWVFSQDGSPLTQVSQFDPRSGTYTGVQFHAIDHNGGQPDLASGACFTTQWDPLNGILFCVVLGRVTQFDYHDRVQGYEITPFSQWLRVFPRSGTIVPGDGLDLNITLDFGHPGYVLDSVYQATITVENNSAEAPRIPVTVGLRSAINEKSPDLPLQFLFSQNYPNPFNSVTMITFALPKASNVRLEVFNILGQRVATLVDGFLPAGRHHVSWDAANVASGVYYCRISAGDLSRARKMLLLK